MFQVIFIFSDWILIKQVIVSSTPFCCSWNIFLKKCCLLELVIIFSLGCYDKNLGVIFDWGRAWVKMPRYNAFSRNVNIMYLKILRTHGVIYKFEKEFNKHSGERDKALRSLSKYERMYPMCTWVEINTVYHFGDSKQGLTEKECVKIVDRCTFEHLYCVFKKMSCKVCLLFYWFFGHKKE